eukprot:gene48156-58983_t
MLRGSLPSISKDWRKSSSAVICAVPLIRSALPLPGIRNMSATLGSRRMLRRLSMRSLPRRSGKASVTSSRMSTNCPGASPRGEQSSPSGPAVASATKGEASIMRRYSGVNLSITLMIDASPGC